MARGRMLNQTVSASLKLHHLPDDTCRLLATWIIPHLDVNGVFYADPAMVRSYVFPRRSDVPIERVAACLDALEEVGLIQRFHARGDTWLWWPGFLDNQAGLRPERETTTYPEPPQRLQRDDSAAPKRRDPLPAAPPTTDSPIGVRQCESASRPLCDPAADRRHLAGILPAEEKRSEKNRNTRVASPQAGGTPPQTGSTLPQQDHTARGAPSAGADSPPSFLPRTFQDWKAALDTYNPPALVRRMCEVLYPDHEPPDYGLIGATARRMGEGKNGYHRLVGLLWEYATRAPQGDLLPYLLRVHQGQEVVYGRPRAGGTEQKEGTGARLSREIAAAFAGRTTNGSDGVEPPLPALRGAAGARDPAFFGRPGWRRVGSATLSSRRASARRTKGARGASGRPADRRELDEAGFRRPVVSLRRGLGRPAAHAHRAALNGRR